MSNHGDEVRLQVRSRTSYVLSFIHSSIQNEKKKKKKNYVRL